MIYFPGGSLIAYLIEGLPAIKTDWSKWTLAFCDERMVPEDSEDSTYGTYKKGLIPKTELTETQFITIKQNVTGLYFLDLFPGMDLGTHLIFVCLLVYKNY